ncbi:hypothetical protein ZYGM_004568 [Zygosaccharomyces mellis]|uniref:Pre-mRNA-splicing factor 38 n=1 Tax=Zygosaccharomyces mellis TaxID=42258 RepID=A0A4C2DZH5_9SACH|nr:hypothetical protein ZYGM_004568 [Zygosaccharomyces mellis]
MPQEFHVESFLSPKQLNHQSVSLVIPRILRDRIHNAMYYRVNLNTASLRGDTINRLCRVLVRDLGTLKSGSVNQVNLLGGIEFQCLLMKLIEIKPTLDQLTIMLQDDEQFNNKYIVCLVLTYLRIQYYYLPVDDPHARRCQSLFKQHYNDYRKMKSVQLDQDCWSRSQTINVDILHTDELVDWLLAKEDIWGIPLGKCQWTELYEDDDDDDDDEED